MKKYLFFTSIAIITLSITVGGVFNAQATVEYTTDCTAVSSTSDLFTKITSAQGAINSLSNSSVKTNLKNRLDYVWAQFNIICMQNSFTNANTYLNNSGQVLALYERYQSTEVLDESLGNRFDTELSTIQSQFTNLTITANCPLTTPAPEGNGTCSSPTPGINYSAYNNNKNECDFAYTSSIGADTDIEYPREDNDHCVQAGGSDACAFDRIWIPAPLISLLPVNSSLNDDPANYTIEFSVVGGNLIYNAPPTSLDYNTSPTENDQCTFQCDLNYDWNPATGVCSPHTEQVNCEGSYQIPNASITSDTMEYAKTWNGTSFPIIEWHWSDVKGECTYDCLPGYHNEGNSCVSNAPRQVSCGIPAPNGISSYSTDTGDNGTYTQTWNGSSWSSNSWNSSSTAGECTYVQCGANEKVYTNASGVKSCRTYIFTNPQKSLYINNVATDLYLWCDGIGCISSNQPTADQYCIENGWNSYSSVVVSSGTSQYQAKYNTSWSDINTWFGGYDRYTGQITCQ